MCPRGKAQSPAQHPGDHSPQGPPNAPKAHPVLLSSRTLRAAAPHADPGCPQGVSFQALLPPHNSPVCSF